MCIDGFKEVDGENSSENPGLKEKENEETPKCLGNFYLGLKMGDKFTK